MARLTYNPSNSTVTFNDVLSLTIGTTQIVTSNATTLALRTTVSGVINGTLDVTFGGTFQILGGFPVGGAFTSLQVDLNSQTLLRLTDFSIPLSGAAPDFTNLQSFLGGADVLSGSALADLMEGFAGADTLDGGAGADILQGNTGEDTLSGGDGSDVLRGGKDNDSLSGGAGADFVSGDRGNDTVAGGAGADIFHVFTGSGVERVTDFSRAEGDRVFVTGAYTVSQSGADVLIDLGGGTQMVLVGVSQTSLTDGWVFS